MGFLASLSIRTYVYIGIALAFIGLTAAVKIQTSRLATSKAETVAVQGKFDAFVSTAKALGEAQNIKTKEIELSNKQLKEKADAQNAKSKADLAALYAKYDRLRKQGSNTNFSLLPKPAADSPSPAVVTFDRAAFDRGMAIADGILQEGATRILQRGDASIVDLNNAKSWASRTP